MLSCRVEAAPAAAPPLLDMGQPTWVSIAQFYEEEDSGSSRSSSRCVSPVALQQLRHAPSLFRARFSHEFSQSYASLPQFFTFPIICIVVTKFHFPFRSSSRGSLRSERLSVTNGNSPLLHAFAPGLLPPFQRVRVVAANDLGAGALLHAHANVQVRSSCFPFDQSVSTEAKHLTFPFFRISRMGNPQV